MRTKSARRRRCAKQLALEFKKRNQKDRALRLLGEIKTMKANVVKLSSYNTMFLKQKGNLDTVAIDKEAADILKGTVS